MCINIHEYWESTPGPFHGTCEHSYNEGMTHQQKIQKGCHFNLHPYVTEKWCITPNAVWHMGLANNNIYCSKWKSFQWVNLYCGLDCEWVTYEKSRNGVTNWYVWNEVNVICTRVHKTSWKNLVCVTKQKDYSKLQTVTYPKQVAIPPQYCQLDTCY